MTNDYLLWIRANYQAAVARHGLPGARAPPGSSDMGGWKTVTVPAPRPAGGKSPCHRLAILRPCHHLATPSISYTPSIPCHPLPPLTPLHLPTGGGMSYLAAGNY